MTDRQLRTLGVLLLLGCLYALWRYHDWVRVVDTPDGQRHFYDVWGREVAGRVAQ